LGPHCKIIEMNDEPKMTTNGSDATPEVSILFKQFLETVHPSVVRKVSGLWRDMVRYNAIETPDLRLHCPNCDGERTFRCDQDLPLEIGRQGGQFMSYLCSDCRKADKLFSLWIVPSNNAGRGGEVYKYGEKPSFGVPVPNKLLRLFGSDRETFLKGRLCENQSLGVGAFAYYRRVVENHKNDLFDEIIRVCETVGAPQELIAELGSAKNEVSFTKSIDHIKMALPQGLLINGQKNPLLALHGALSVGLHNETDEECLQAARAVRLVLSVLVEKMSILGQDDKELHAAVHFLYRAAQVEAPPAVLLGSSGYASRANPFAPNAAVDAQPLVKYAQESARRNKVAASWSAAAAFFAFLACALGVWVSWTSVAH
jgi:hypothetical protein